MILVDLLRLELTRRRLTRIRDELEQILADEDLFLAERGALGALLRSAGSGCLAGGSQSVSVKLGQLGHGSRRGYGVFVQ